MRVMPVWKPNGEKFREVDPLALYHWLAQEVFATRSLDEDVVIVVEKPVGAKSANAMRSMAASFATAWATCGIFLNHAGNGSKLLTRISAREWQKALLDKGDTKKMAIKKAAELWPDEKFLASDRCKVPHSGLVDASLVAEYARRNL